MIERCNRGLSKKTIKNKVWPKAYPDDAAQKSNQKQTIKNLAAIVLRVLLPGEL
jgi:hypothetical protein